MTTKVDVRYLLPGILGAAHGLAFGFTWSLLFAEALISLRFLGYFLSMGFAAGIVFHFLHKIPFGVPSAPTELSWFPELVGSILWPVMGVLRIFTPSKKKAIWSHPWEVYSLFGWFENLSWAKFNLLGIRKWDNNTREVWLPVMCLTACLLGWLVGALISPMPGWIGMAIWYVGYLAYFRNAFGYFGMFTEHAINKKRPFGFTNAVLLLPFVIVVVSNL